MAKAASSTLGPTGSTLASDHGDKDDAFDIIVLVDGNVCVTMLLHDIEA